MEWDVTISSDRTYVEIVTRGIADEEGSFKMASAIKETMRSEHITRVLIDHRNLTGVTGTITAVYNRPKLFRLIGVILGIRIAEVVQPAHREHFVFLETVCQNAGFKLGVFYDHAKALAWLLDRSGSVKAG